MDIYIGIDFGTSGCRAIAIDNHRQVQAGVSIDLPEPEQIERQRLQAPQIWLDHLFKLLAALLQQVDPGRVRALAIDGTSATLLPLGADNRPLGPARLYNDSSNDEAARIIDDHAPADSPARGSSSSLAKALGFMHEYPGLLTAVAHQADWLAARLTGGAIISDENNALKLGYDPVTRCWPTWISQSGLPASMLPRVVAPGTLIGMLGASAARQTGLNRQCQVVAGSTDSTAAFIATGASRPGEAVTSLGSTMVLKVVSEKPVTAARYGIYSHRLGGLWIAGGASNAGGAVLRQFFTDEQMQQLSTRLVPNHATGLDYYPLPSTGERFPIADPVLEPRLTPRPDDDTVFFQRLVECGAPAPGIVHTVGGGSRNAVWRQMRENALGVPVDVAQHSEAAYGSALLARLGVTGSRL